jgi:hypothetical protein
MKMAIFSDIYDNMWKLEAALAGMQGPDESNFTGDRRMIAGTEQPRREAEADEQPEPLVVYWQIGHLGSDRGPWCPKERHRKGRSSRKLSFEKQPMAPSAASSTKRIASVS